MVDIHCHLLPSVDDGARDLVEALEMARAAVVAGTTTVVATPHVRSDFPGVVIGDVGQRLAALRGAIEDAGIPLEVVVGAEVALACAIEMSEAELRDVSYGQRGRDLLIETPAGRIDVLSRMLYQVRCRGYRVTLAHPERSVAFQRDFRLIEEVAAQGVLLQVNADSVLGRTGSSKLARELCVRGLASAIASDAHHAEGSRLVTSLRDAHLELQQLVGDALASWLTQVAPACIIAGEQLPERPLPLARSAKRWRTPRLRR